MLLITKTYSGDSFFVEFLESGLANSSKALTAAIIVSANIE